MNGKNKEIGKLKKDQMDKALEIYLIATNTIALVSLIGFVVLISNKISQKNSFKFFTPKVFSAIIPLYSHLRRSKPWRITEH